MSNFSEIIHIESLRKQLLKQIEVLDNQISNLNQSVKQKGLEINQSQIENTLDIGKFINELKASEIDLALLQKWLELLNSGVDPKSIDLEQLKLDVIENAQSAQESFEDQFLDFEEMANLNEGMIAVSNRLGKQYFSPNLHPDIYKDKESVEAQSRLNTTMSEPELAGSVFTDIFPKTLKQLLKSSELTEDQNLVIKNLLLKYNLIIEKENLSDEELKELLITIKSDEELKLIFKQSPGLKPLLNTTLKETILDIELPEGKPVTELKEIIIRKKSEIAFLQKQLETVDEMTTKEGQDKILDINEQYFKQIQELKSQIETLNLQIRDKIKSMNLQDQQAAKAALEATKSSLESVFANSAERVEPDKGAIVIKQARAEIINNNFETEQKEYKEKLRMLPNQFFEKLNNDGKLGNLIINNVCNGLSTGRDIPDKMLWDSNHKCCLYSEKFSFEKLNKHETNIRLDFRFGLVKVEINETQFETKDFEADGHSYKEIFNRIKAILIRDYDIDIDNLESKNVIEENDAGLIKFTLPTFYTRSSAIEEDYEINIKDRENWGIEQSSTNAIENQETLAREKYKQIQDICNKLEQKDEAGEFGQRQLSQFDDIEFIKNLSSELGDVGKFYYNFDTFTLNITHAHEINVSSVSFENGDLRFSIVLKLDFNKADMDMYNRVGDRFVKCFKTIDYGQEPPPRYIQPTLEQLNLFYDELTKLLRENNIEL